MRRTTLTIFVIVAAVLAVLGRSQLLGDPDTFWHIAVGRRILATGAFPTSDNYTYTAQGQPWLANQWLAECGMAIVDRWAGFDGILGVGVSAVAAMYAWIASRFLRAGAHWTVAVLALALVFGASAYNLVARPHLATMVLMPVLYGWLLDIESQGRRLTSLWFAPLVFLVWANLHGGVLGGVATLGLAFSGWIALYLLRQPTPVRAWRDVWTLVGVGVTSVAVLIVNPYGLGMFDAWQRILSMDLPNLVIEHARLDPRRLEGLGVILVFGVYGVVLLSAARRGLRVTWWLPAIWCYLAFSRIRHGPLFASMALLAVADQIPGTAWCQRLARRDFWQLNAVPVAGHRIWLATALLIPVLALCLAGIVHQSSVGKPSSGWAHPLPRIWPADQQAALDTLSPRPGGPLRIFNDQLYGGFLIYACPGKQVFIDGRCELFGEPLLREYLAAQQDSRILAQWLETYPSDAALVRTRSPFDQYFAQRADWKLVHRTPGSSLYEYQGPRVAQQLHAP